MIIDKIMFTEKVQDKSEYTRILSNKNNNKELKLSFFSIDIDLGNSYKDLFYAGRGNEVIIEANEDTKNKILNTMKIIKEDLFGDFDFDNYDTKPKNYKCKINMSKFNRKEDKRGFGTDYILDITKNEISNINKLLNSNKEAFIVIKNSLKNK